MKKIVLLNLIVITLLFLRVNIHAQEIIIPPKNPNSAKGCAICHYRWVDTFFIEGKGSDLVGYTSQKAVATPEMCFSCHDGSVMDSRARAYQTRQHKTNVRPPSIMKIPDILPLDEQGNMQCATCHTAHGVPSGPDSQETIFMRTSNRNSEMCRMCHPEMNGGGKMGNHPLDTTKLEIPGSLIDLDARVGVKANQVVCETCHTAHGSPYENYLIKNDRDSSLCLACHPDKDSLTPGGEKRPVHVINAQPSTANIPEKLLRQGAKLGSDGELICQTCHRVHQNTVAPQLLLFKKDEKSTFCLSCHSDKGYIADTKHNLAVSAPAEKNLEGKTVAQAGVCSACHLPHRPARRLSGNSDYTTRLCMSCHSKGKVAGKKNLIGTTHPLSVYPFAKKGANSEYRSIRVDKDELNLPLFDRAGVRNRNGKMTCATCHDTHRPPADAASSTASKAGQTKIKSFLRKPSPEICGECHREKFSIANTKHNLSTSAPDEKNILNQTPAQSGLCGSCHIVHGPRRNFLWARPTATGEGKGLETGLCISCHHEAGIAKNKVNKGYNHPTNIAPRDKGLSTVLPLIDGKGQFSANGVIACQTCHDPHQWKPEQTAAEPGKGSSEVQKQVTSFLRKPSPGICGECHHDKLGIANTDHDLSKTAPEEKNSRGQKPAQAGLCGNCHLPHNAQKSFLWARTLKVESDDVVEDLCISCHSASGIAGKKVLSGYSHPLNMKPSEKGMDPTLPLFDKNGKELDKGFVTCHTCHDPHRWAPLKTLIIDHYKIEGNSQNSFLRIENSPSPGLCKDCHPEQGAVEKTDHDLLKSAPDSKNSLKQAPAESGTCGACHVVHNSKNTVKLWARKLPPGLNVMDAICNSCHSKNGPAKNKFPRIASHPQNALIINIAKSKKRRNDYLPLFDESTGNRIMVGNISCPSCHNAHQWNSRSTPKGKGTPEGSALNSFLRASSYQLICRDCHGPDALYKYLYFHDPDKRSANKK
jgi:predicted CXXCH cytochrome family protein